MKLSQVNLVCEAQVSLGQKADESANPSGTIEARVTTWGAREGADGRKFFYKPEGFAQWADEFSEAGKPLPMFYNHNDMEMPCGEWNEFTFDEEGMTAKGRLYLSTVKGSDLYNILKESPMMMGGVSVGAYADEARMVDESGEPLMSGDDSDEGYFQITKGGLREVSVVMYPNNLRAEIQQLECFDAEGHLNPRVLEKLLREAGVDKKDATTASSIFKKILEQREATKETIEATPSPSDSGAVVENAEDILKALELRELAKALNQRIK